VILRVEGLRKAFGALTVVQDLDTAVASGECLGVMGPNGAGKSTFFDLLAGVARADAGRVLIEGRDVTALPPEARVRAGLARAFQIPKPFATLTVAEHLLLAADAGAGLRGRAAEARTAEVLELTGLTALSGVRGGQLRLLDRKRLELAKALATGPKVLLLDEVSGGLTEPEVQSLVALIRRLQRPGLAILWIEHIAHALQATCDRIMMLHLGAKVIEDLPDRVIADPRVRALYLGVAVHA
jgi:branched-chain amino acid transport system ATP-binding protein